MVKSPLRARPISPPARRILAMAAVHFVLVLVTLSGVLVLLPGIDEGRKPVGSLERLAGNASKIGLVALTAPLLLLHKWAPSLFVNNAIEWSLCALNSLLYGSMAACLWFVVARRHRPSSAE